ncbi:MAG: hypothetical protein SH850_30455 [Planctomycetaceae bacterium]|nr:hypothetical protein [Planctomycetaceae bacterium]
MIHRSTIRVGWAVPTSKEESAWFREAAWWAQPTLCGFQQSPAVFDAFRKVDPQDCDCRPADRCLSNQLGTVPHEMLVPHVLARIKQRVQLIGGRIVTRNVRSLERVAVKASQSQIAQGAGAMMFLRPDVIDFMR